MEFQVFSASPWLDLLLSRAVTAITRDFLRILRFRPRVILHIGGPLEKMPELLALTEHESPELQKADFVHLQPGVGLHTPAEIGTAPRRQPVTAGCVPEKSEELAHPI